MTSKALRASFVCTLMLLSLCGTLAQSSNPAERLQQLTDATSLDRAGAKPWHLRMHFQLYDLDGKAEDAGLLDVWWTGAGHRRVKVESPAMQGPLLSPSQAFANGKAREAYLLLELLQQVVHPVPDYSSRANLSTTERSRTFGKVTLDCLRVQTVSHAMQDDSPGTAPEFCSQVGDADVLRVRFDPGRMSIARNRLAKFQEINVALDNDLSYNAKLAISGKTEVLESADPSTLPADAALEPVLPTIPGVVTAAHRLRGEPPQYPRYDRDKGIMGSVVLSVQIDKQGKVTNIVPIASRDLQLTGAAMSAVQTWTYSPTLLGGEPIAIDTTIAVNFNLTQSRF